MCGIVGIIGGQFEGLEAMSSRLSHRGPDDHSYWSDTEAGVGLAHRRLSILDLSPAGRQPMTSPSGRYVIVYNGEIYNHLEMRRILDNSRDNSLCVWQGHSDTETLLVGFDAWGIEETILRCVGMFAMAVWDRAERKLILIRDRLGEKPLYYGWNRGLFLFASELKAIRAFPGFVSEINRDALSLMLRHSYIPAPHSIYRGIFKLEPGFMFALKVSAADSCPWGCDDPPSSSFFADGVSFHRYWSLAEVAGQSRKDLFVGTEKEAVDELERVLSDAVRAQQISDVPLGAFLSGGVDSSVIVALMQSRADRPSRTFTVGFHEAGYNEAVYAGNVARYLKTDHTKLYVTSEEARAVIPQLPAIYDEPFSDPSQIPMFLVAQLARRHVTVSLSGDGGDELFGGYNRYLQMKNLLHRTGWLPNIGRHALAKGMTAISPSGWNNLYTFLEPLLPRSFRMMNAGDKMHKLAEVITANSPVEIYYRLVSHWKSPAEVVVDAREPVTALVGHRLPDNTEFEHHMMYLDAISYLPDDILVKVDRAAMAVSLETRVPFLDHRVVEFAWRLPLSMKIRNGQGKWILRQVLYRHVPRELIERPKQGFGVPLDSWLRGPLREWAEELLDERRLHLEGFFRPEPIRRKWREHLSGACNWQYYLWDVLMFQAWLEHNK